MNALKDLVVGAVVSATITLESVDVTVKIGVGVVGIVYGIFRVLKMRTDIRNNKLDEEIKQQQLYDIIQSNKKKHG